ncbi:MULTISPECIES: pyridoxal 5'-phosphate synthase glutaminase subunit PdxT [Bacillus]|jgi:5'-phosphate synthase pdxT subunit|uniref:pyridoxal 5'-phosphate synthase glutaminase subunit PdxT n=1 Tax=Bacillus TaxID=1386 RepID=UPI00032DCB39|nr:pyridoxal 5'-phosphate synthase glutaminase subunit PdxT [Bacillus wiedmannii]EOP15624.1 glutamine amidotransferase subunit pdxT [Bacillus cereus BAG2O-3]EOQ19090.1 glutamine amidotransferase subunit pdxT [Bacillus cereus B5-2]EOQ35236.1 glutamine amidotransferase subunit pdxT [Bacillus cereus BAG3O-1]MBJ8119786.1 pyridoxal 5'-phosphate synthase glutaminase subunit PdxT [Bacillus cereus]RFB07502.1 pyridoxal 5'-phosphate synthase glutaminase subunit PdxT [Bacillus sp. OE]RFB19515.1 pyridoxa
MVKIGVLGLQGAVREHVKSVEASGAEAVVVKRIEQLEEIDGLILPGGESTTMRRLIDKYAFMEPLRTFAKSGKPMFGTCAGMILLAKTLIGYEEAHIGAMDITVERNAFGRQKDSFEATLSMKGVGEEFIGVFIRAPYVVNVADDVEVLSTHGDRMVAVKQNQFLAASFHPELTDDHRVTAYFVEMVKEAKMKKVV